MHLGAHKAGHVLCGVGEAVAGLQLAVAPRRQQHLGRGQPGLPAARLRELAVNLRCSTAPQGSAALAATVYSFWAFAAVCVPSYCCLNTVTDRPQVVLYFSKQGAPQQGELQVQHCSGVLVCTVKV